MKSRLDRAQNNTVFRPAVLCLQQKKVKFYNSRNASSFLPVQSFEDSPFSFGDFFVPGGLRVDVFC